MRSLTLIRHAESGWNTETQNDSERPLNELGQRDAPMMAQRIVAAGISPSMVISSPAVRAVSTAQIIARALSYPDACIQYENALYLASGETILELIASQDPSGGHLMIVGHNPGLTVFVNYLIPGLTENLPTTGVVSVRFDSNTWNLRASGKCELLLFDYPTKAH